MQQLHPYDGLWTECRRAELLKTSTFSPTRGFAEGTSLSLENVEVDACMHEDSIVQKGEKGRHTNEMRN